MNSNDSSNDQNQEQNGVLTRAQRKKLLEENNCPELEVLDDNQLDAIEEELEHLDETDYETDIEDNDSQNNLLDIMTQCITKVIEKKIADNPNILLDDNDVDDDVDDNIEVDDNGYYLGDGFVVPDDYNSDEDNDYDPNASDGYETDIEDDVGSLFKNVLSLLPLQPLNNQTGSIKQYNMSKKEADVCQQYFDIMRPKNNSPESYFMNLNMTEKLQVIEQEKKIKNQLCDDIPLRFQILSSNLPEHVKAMAIAKVSVLEDGHHGSDYYKTKEWLDGLMNIPFGNIVKMPVTLFNTSPQIRDFLHDSNQILDNAIYGQSDTKTHVIQIISQLISNPESIGNVFSIYGPMGTGKTSLVKKGIAKVLNRPFTLISLGGMTDASFFRGHSYTYEGSRPGRIVEILKEAKCMNPIIYFDELDKVSDTPKGEEIIHTLIHLTDKSQNMNFQDSYYSGIPLDLSKVIFIFSYNDESKINPILRDRMYKISVNGFTIQEKINIAIDYLLKDIYFNFNFNPDSLLFTNEVIKYIINNHTKDEYGNVEKGVRNLERALETIVSKLNVMRLYQNDSFNVSLSFAQLPENTGLYNPNQTLIKSDDCEIDIDDIDIEHENLLPFEQNIPPHFDTFDIIFPFTITPSVVDKLLKTKPINASYNMMYI